MENKKIKKEYKYWITAEVDVNVSAKNKPEALKKASEVLKDLKIWNYKVNPQKRTSKQNRGLHLLFTQISKECLNKGIEMRDIVKDEIPIQATPENIKWLWKRLQNALLKKKSTTQLKKLGEIEIVYDNFNKILIDRTNGRISLPPFPSIKTQFKDEIEPEYPNDYTETAFD